MCNRKLAYVYCQKLMLRLHTASGKRVEHLSCPGSCLSLLFLSYHMSLSAVLLITSCDMLRHGVSILRP